MKAPNTGLQTCCIQALARSRPMTKCIQQGSFEPAHALTPVGAWLAGAPKQHPHTSYPQPYLHIHLHTCIITIPAPLSPVLLPAPTHRRGAGLHLARPSVCQQRQLGVQNGQGLQPHLHPPAP
eukprot:1161745-Pelagomonas_calceolata.AAC.9